VRSESADLGEDLKPKKEAVKKKGNEDSFVRALHVNEEGWKKKIWGGLRGFKKRGAKAIGAKVAQK